MSGDVFDCLDWGREGATGILCVEARDAAKPPEGTRQPLTMNNHLLQSVNSVVTAVLATLLSCLYATSMVWEEARSAVHPPK